jgi:hypothetical protein
VYFMESHAQATTLVHDVDDLVSSCRVLTEYECGRAQIAIEWVARGQKPIAEIGGRPITDCDISALACDLDGLICKSGESVFGFLAPEGADRCMYGFYKYPWAIGALLHVLGIERAPEGARQSSWLQGLVFGYSPSAIQEFISSGCAGPESNSHPSPYNLGKVGIYGTLAPLVRRRNNQSDRFQKSG